MCRATLVIIVFATETMFSISAMSHHSRSAFDDQETIELQGRVVELLWANPHVYIDLAVEDESGDTRIWSIEFETPSALVRAGYSRDRLLPGQLIEVLANPPRRAGQLFAFGNSVTFADGSEASMTRLREELESEPARVASSLQGRWRSAPRRDGQERAGFTDPGSNWALTQAGSDALASYDELGSNNPVLDCLLESTPHLMNLPFVYDIQTHENSVTIQVEGREEVRTIVLGVNSHEGGSDSYHGYSIGWWEGDALVVDTRRFTPSLTGNSYKGVPSSDQKRLTERFELAPGGTHLVYSWTLEDPVYLAEPVSRERYFLNRPDLAVAELVPCSVDSARRFADEVEE